MVDVVLNSLENSSLAKALTHNNSVINPFVYQLKKGVVPFSRNKYEVPFKETDFNKNMRLKINKLGLVQNMTLKIKVQIEGGGAVGGDGTEQTGDLKPKTGGGISIIRRCALSNGKDEILVLNKETLNYMMSTFEWKKEVGMKLMSQYGGVQADLYTKDGVLQSGFVEKLKKVHDGGTLDGVTYTATKATATFYIPLLFTPFCNDKTAEYLDFSFFQQLYLNVDLDGHENLIDGTTTSNKPSIDWQNSKLIVNYLNFTNPDYSQIQRNHFHHDLNYLYSDYWLFDDVVVSLQKNTLAKAVVPIPCDKLIKRIYIRVNAKSKDELGMKGLECIDKVTLSAVGREVIEFDGTELLAMRYYESGGKGSAPFISNLNKNTKESRFSTAGTQFPSDDNYNIDELDSVYYIVDFTLPALCRNEYEAEPTYSGGVSFKNNMNAELTITLNDYLFEDSAHDVEVKTFAEHYSVLRINENSGEIEVAENR